LQIYFREKRKSLRKKILLLQMVDISF
jgi:hypothetical protein